MNQERNTIFKKLLVPIMSILLLQAVLYTAVFFGGGIVRQSEDNSFAIFNEKVINRAQYMENSIANSWFDLAEGEALIVNTLHNELNSAGADSNSLLRNAPSDAMIGAVLDNLIYILRKNNVTGAYFVFDGGSSITSSGLSAHSGIYIRDIDPSSPYDESNADLLYDCGPIRIANSEGLTLSSTWSPYFVLGEYSGNEDDSFYFSPLSMARFRGATEGEGDGFGYWTSSLVVGERSMSALSYSIPIILDDAVVGVLGVDISYNHISDLMKYAELCSSGNASYVLGILDGNGVHVERIVANGPIYQNYFSNSSSITLKEFIGNDILNLVETDYQYNPALLVSVQLLDLGEATRYYQRQGIALIGIAEQMELTAYADSMRRLIYFSTLISLFLGALGVLLASRVITSPISSLASELRSANPDEPIELKRVNIGEIDVLTKAIEDLSHKVADSASKLTKAIDVLNMPVGVFEYNLSTGRVFCSRRWFEYADGRIVEADQYISKDEFEDQLLALEDCIVDKNNPTYLIEREGQAPMWLRLTMIKEDGLILGVLNDITTEVLERQRIEYERDYDVLTEMYNRRAFEQIIYERFSNPATLKTAALVMFDLDNLKVINDTYGHETGDAYICAFADIIRDFNDDNGIAARRSGDELYAFIYGYDSREAAQRRIDDVWGRLLRQSIVLPNGTSLRVQASAGVAWYPRDADNAEDLLRYVDFAMYSVKHSAKGRIQHFDKHAYQQNSVMLNGAEALTQLIEHELVYYVGQPIIEVATGDVYGYEMLMRSNMQELPTVRDILRLASVQGKLKDIEDLTFFAAMRTYAQQVENNVIARGTKIFINSIGGQVMSKDKQDVFFNQYAQYINDLVVEIAEEHPATNEAIREKVDMLKRRNARIALDNYGSGYNNESSLIRFSTDIVKVDISIISGIHMDANRRSILANLVSYCKPRGIKVLAEGVETREELESVVNLGVDYLQGYYFAKPALELGHVDEAAMAAMGEFYAGFRTREAYRHLRDR